MFWETQGHPMRYYVAWELRQESELERAGLLGFFSLLAEPQGHMALDLWWLWAGKRWRECFCKSLSLWVSRECLHCPLLISFHLTPEFCLTFAEGGLEMERQRKGRDERTGSSGPEVLRGRALNSVLGLALLLSWASAFSSAKWRLRASFLPSLPSSHPMEEGETGFAVRQLTHGSHVKN